jgi:hypothetical protein
LTASHSSAGIFLGSTTGRGGSEKENPEERERRDREKEKWRQKKRNEVAQYFVDGWQLHNTVFFFL